MAKKKIKGTRILAAILTAAMVFTSTPYTALAAESEVGYVTVQNEIEQTGQADDGTGNNGNNGENGGKGNNGAGDFPMAPTKQVTYRATPAITEITAVAVMPATYRAAPATFLTITVAPAKQAMYQTVTEAPATCPVPTARHPFPAMTLRYTV